MFQREVAAAMGPNGPAFRRAPARQDNYRAAADDPIPDLGRYAGQKIDLRFKKTINLKPMALCKQGY